MKRSLIVLCAAALLATLPLASVAEAAKPAKVTKHARHNKHDKRTKHNKCAKHAKPAEQVMVEIWHVTRVINVGYGLGVGVGRVIKVSENVVPAHEAHGDRIFNSDDNDFFYWDELWQEFFEVVYGVNINLADGQPFIMVNM